MGAGRADDAEMCIKNSPIPNPMIETSIPGLQSVFTQD